MVTLARFWTTALALALCGAAVSGCSGEEIGRTLGFVRDSPDEFMVTTRAPLAMPPSYTLQPPTPGVARPQEQSERQKAEQALVPQMVLGTGGDEAPSPGQQALVQAAGPPPPQGIRTAVDQQAKLDHNTEGFFDRMAFWRKPLPPGIVVDPQKEAQRLRENAALGQNPENGETPVVQPKRRGWLEGIF